MLVFTTLEIKFLFKNGVTELHIFIFDNNNFY